MMHEQGGERRRDGDAPCVSPLSLPLLRFVFFYTGHLLAVG
jgi:hypothetical protein